MVGVKGLGWWVRDKVESQAETLEGKTLIVDLGSLQFDLWQYFARKYPAKRHTILYGGGDYTALATLVDQFFIKLLRVAKKVICLMEMPSEDSKAYEANRNEVTTYHRVLEAGDLDVPYGGEFERDYLPPMLDHLVHLIIHQHATSPNENGKLELCGGREGNALRVKAQASMVGGPVIAVSSNSNWIFAATEGVSLWLSPASMNSAIGKEKSFVGVVMEGSHLAALEKGPTPGEAFDDWETVGGLARKTKQRNNRNRRKGGLVAPTWTLDGVLAEFYRNIMRRHQDSIPSVDGFMEYCALLGDDSHSPVVSEFRANLWRRMCVHASDREERAGWIDIVHNGVVNQPTKANWTSQSSNPAHEKEIVQARKLAVKHWKEISNPHPELQGMQGDPLLEEFGQGRSLVTPHPSAFAYRRLLDVSSFHPILHFPLTCAALVGVPEVVLDSLTEVRAFVGSDLPNSEGGIPNYQTLRERPAPSRIAFLISVATGRHFIPPPASFASLPRGRQERVLSWIREAADRVATESLALRPPEEPQTFTPRPVPESDEEEDSDDEPASPFASSWVQVEEPPLSVVPSTLSVGEMNPSASSWGVGSSMTSMGNSTLPNQSRASTLGQDVVLVTDEDIYTPGTLEWVAVGEEEGLAGEVLLWLVEKIAGEVKSSGVEMEAPEVPAQGIVDWAIATLRFIPEIQIWSITPGLILRLSLSLLRRSLQYSSLNGVEGEKVEVADLLPFAVASTRKGPPPISGKAVLVPSPGDASKVSVYTTSLRWISDMCTVIGLGPCNGGADSPTSAWMPQRFLDGPYLAAAMRALEPGAQAPPPSEGAAGHLEWVLAQPNEELIPGA